MMEWIWVRFYWEEMNKDFVDSLEILNKLIYFFVHLISLLVGQERFTKLVQGVKGPLDINPSTIVLSSSFVSDFKGYWGILCNGLVGSI